MRPFSATAAGCALFRVRPRFIIVRHDMTMNSGRPPAFDVPGLRPHKVPAWVGNWFHILW